MNNTVAMMTRNNLSIIWISIDQPSFIYFMIEIIIQRMVM